MRDILLATFLLGSLPFIVWRPTIGVFMWTWVSVMSPHRLAYGFAYDFSFAQLIAIATLLGMLFSREPKRMAVTPVTVVLFVLVLWMNLTTFFAIDTDQSMAMWERVMKIQLMVFVSIWLLHTKQQIHLFIWIVAGSVAFFGIKGGLFTLREEGEGRVFGPPGSFIEENNALALATIMAIPLMYFLSTRVSKAWAKWAFVVAIGLCGLSALGSYSRGGLLALGAMMVFFWWHSRRRFLVAVILVLLVPVGVGFMPEKWMDRMQSIQTYQADESAMGRINAWMTAINLANDRPLVGGGFDIDTRRVFDRYAPDPTVVRAAHSIYFQMLGEHGYVGLFLFVLLWMFVWRDASWIARETRSRGSEWRWAFDLARMCQVSLVGYFVGGAFLSLAYYDVPYDIIVALVLTRVLVEKEISSAPRKVSAPAPQESEPAVSGEPEVATETRFDRRGEA